MASSKARYRLEREFMFAPRRDGAALALRLLDLAESTDERVRGRIPSWFGEVARLLPPVSLETDEFDGLSFEAVLTALLIAKGVRSMVPTVGTHVLEAMHAVEGHPQDVEADVRSALTKAVGQARSPRRTPGSPADPTAR